MVRDVVLYFYFLYAVTCFNALYSVLFMMYTLSSEVEVFQHV